ncbi:MAG: hypothetical protein EP305_00015 [Bacteroidetes bacterium]|nr:MAG: hypothetical protein EP305_00015 [Bacteroidota bacterium]
MEYNSIDHAVHNESVCQDLAKNPDYKDWVITTAFYSSLHYLRHAIFPLKFNSSKRGMKVTATSFNTYCLIEGHEGKKHSVFKKLVDSECPNEIGVAYHRLLDASYTARYNQYKFSDKIANKAMGRLTAIKNYSSSLKKTA